MKTKEFIVNNILPNGGKERKKRFPVEQIFYL
jgi:hypothetical protein